MAKVIFTRFRGTDQQRAEIDGVLCHQDNGYFFVITGDAQTIEIDRGRTSAFNVNRGNCGADYYASLIAGTDNYELSECYVKSTSTANPTQINIFGYFPTIGDALRDLMAKGNTTNDGREPSQIYI